MTIPVPEQAVLTFTGLDRDTARQISGALGELAEPAADAIAIFEDGETFRIDAYFPDRLDAQHALVQLETFGGVYARAAQAALLAAVPPENWVALSQAKLPPVVAGRFTICGSHDLYRVPNGPGTIVIEAGEAFGTAHHATTYGCLLAIDRVTRRRHCRSALDLGTGSGVLALALARVLPAARIVASDIDLRSIEVAMENAKANGRAARSGGPAFLVADGVGDHRIRAVAPFDLVVANILAGPLIAMAPEITTVLRIGGTLLLSGLLVHQAQEVARRYAAFGLDLIRHDRHNGWSTLELARRRLRGSAMASATTSIYTPDND